MSSEGNGNLIGGWQMAKYELRELETLKADLAKLRLDLADLAQKFVDIGVDEVGVVRETLVGEAQGVIDKMRQVFGDTREQGRRTIEGVQRQVEEKPYVIPLVALLAAGLVLALLLGRKSEPETTSKPETETSGRVEIPSEFRAPTSEKRSKKTLGIVQGQIEYRPIVNLLVASGVGLLLNRLIERGAKCGSSS